MGGTAARAGIRGGEELSRDGSEGGIVDGEVRRDCGFVGGAEGSGWNEARRVFGVDRYVLISYLQRSSW